MLELSKIVTISDFDDSELVGWLDRRFGANEAANAPGVLSNARLTEEIRKWGDWLRKNCPRSRSKTLFYLCDHSNSFTYPNYFGRCATQHLWPLFFGKFPKAQIWIAETSLDWIPGNWGGQKELARRFKGKQLYPDGLMEKGAGGLDTDQLPIIALKFLSCGIYPLLICSPTELSHITFIYIPDRSFEYSQMTEGKTLYQEILWNLHDVFDDQWTFLSGRGPKVRVRARDMRPTKQTGYMRWFLETLSSRMSDIISEPDQLKREQMAMTFNRAMCDAQLCISSQFPYMMKVFFFSCLDKLANFDVMLGTVRDEVTAWKNLVNGDFLRNELAGSLMTIPDDAGEYFRNLIENANEVIISCRLDPEYLRDLRNSHHGYKLRSDRFKNLLTSRAEFENDLTLLVAPLILYFLSKPWKCV